MSEQEKILPCPFCNSKAIIRDSGFTDTVFVHCLVCEISTRYGSRDSVIEVWNTRNSQTEQTELTKLRTERNAAVEALNSGLDAISTLQEHCAFKGFKLPDWMYQDTTNSFNLIKQTLDALGVKEGE